MYGTNRPPFTALQGVRLTGSDIPFGLPEDKRRHPKPSFGPSEDQIHRAVVGHLRQRGSPGLVWWHTPNGGKRNRIEASRFNGLGVRAGVADLILIYRGNVYAMELKSSTGRPTVAQMQFMSEFNAAGGHGCICHDLDRAIQVLERWGLLK